MTACADATLGEPLINALYVTEQAQGVTPEQRLLDNTPETSILSGRSCLGTVTVKCEHQASWVTLEDLSSSEVLYSPHKKCVIEKCVIEESLTNS